jgi:hypothetical protein
VVHAGPAATLDACIANAKPATKGLAAFSAECPDLAAAFEELGFAATLQPGWREQLTIGQLKTLAPLARRYEQKTAPAALDRTPLRAIVEGLAKDRGQKSKSWSELLRDWLDSWFSGTGGDDLPWLERWAQRLQSASAVITAATYVMVGGILIGAVVVAIRELRAAGVLSGAKQRSRGMGAPRTPAAEASDLEARFNQASLPEQPSLLLSLLIQRFRRSDRLAADRHLTHREILRRVVLDDSLQRDRLGRLTTIAEQVVYAAQRPARAALESAVRDGRELLRQLERDAAP